VFTVFGVDVSNWDGSVDWNAVAESGIEFAFAKATEGVHFKDRTWARNRAGMLALGERFVPGAYCFLRGDADITRQVEIFLETVGDVSQLMVALDVESLEGAARQATVADAMEWVAEFKSRTGGHPVLGYFPRWYWEQNGQGDLSFFDTLWESHYVSGDGTAEELHNHVPAGWWRSYGNATVSILQFTESCRVPGFPEGPCDVNAYQGDRSQLRALTLTGVPTLVIPGGTPPLSLGSSGVRVAQLQNALNTANLPSGTATATSFWDSETASGLPMRYQTIASPYWPLGTKVKITYASESAIGVVEDFGPSEWAIAQHDIPAIIDLSDEMMAGLTGALSNSVHVRFQVLSWGSGRVYSHSGTGYDLAMAGLTPPLDVDGDFGPLTEAGVKWLQQKANITVTGVYDEVSEAALRTVLQTMA
jgi:GH25 family lysozyme M1 (1,4-beta-N-acetylmuramidase)/peptidoglycan hydrolase-like protein with peptidoglycan-binding domain